MRKRWLFIFLIILAALPGFPPLLNLGLRKALDSVPGQVSWQRVSGYALTGLYVSGLHAEGPGYRADLQEVRVGYNLLALLGHKLPLSLELKNGRVSIDPERLDLGSGSGGGTAIEPILQKLTVENVQIESAAWPSMALPAYNLQITGELPDFDWVLQTADGSLSGRLNFKSLRNWHTSFSGDVALSRFWWDGKQSGQLKGSFGYQKGHWRGSAELSDGRVVLAGFPVTAVTGTISYDDHVITTSLSGESLGGAVHGNGVVDIPAAHYQFSATGEPQLAELLKLWKISLPASGSGPLKITGSGWEELNLQGEFSGKGKFLERPLSYAGSFRFSGGQFTLSTTAAGSVLERDWKGRFEWRDGNYTAVVTDSKGSQVDLSGHGIGYQGFGKLVWPYPLSGEARVDFSGRGTSWQVKVDSPEVGLLLVKSPLDLSGSLAGEGMKVSGRLGPVSFGGRWDDLQMSLAPVRLVVGEVSGNAVWKGRFSFSGSYSSPYTSFPLRVEQEGAEWRGQVGSYGGFVWRDGTFNASVKNLPVEYFDRMKLSGSALWSPEKGWSGRQRLVGRYVVIDSSLEGNAVRFAGSIKTPLGKLPLSGVADASGLRGWLDRAEFSYSGGRFGLSGKVTLGCLSYEGSLAWQGDSWQGSAELKTPWVQARLLGGGSLRVETSGWLIGSGSLLPKVEYSGQLHLPELAGLKVAPPAVRVRGERAKVGDGYVELRSPYRFSLRLPVSYRGYNGQLLATGDYKSGQLKLLTPWGEASASGSWSDLELAGLLQLPRLGRAELAGTVNLFDLSYQLVALLPDAAGKAEVEGRSAEYEWKLSLQNQALAARGWSRGLRVSFDDFDSTFLGLPGKWQGELVYDSSLYGDVSYRGPYGSLRAAGYGALRLEGGGRGYEVGGYLDSHSLHASVDLDLPVASGRIGLEGPWSELRAKGEGIWRLPGFKEQPWRLLADLKSRSWSLSGPISLQGSGLAYQGQLDWKDEIYGKQLSLQGSFSGNGPKLLGQASLDLNGLLVRLGFAHENGWSLNASSPAGEVRLLDGILQLRLLNLAAVGQALGLPLEGRLAGSLDLSGPAGSAGGVLKLAGQSFGAVARPEGGWWTFALYDGSRGLGLQLGWGEGVYLRGLGKLEGRLELTPAFRGELSYAAGGVKARLWGQGEELRGLLDVGGEEVGLSYEADKLQARLRGLVSGSARLDLASQEYRLDASYSSDLAEAFLRLHGVGTVWSGSGFLVGYTGLPQAGPLTLSGEGLDWQVVWSAPLSLRLAGHGAELSRMRVSGAGVLGNVARRWGGVRGDFAYSAGSYQGVLQGAGEGWSLRLEGEGERARVVGGAAFVDLQGYLTANGSIDLSISGQRNLGSSLLRVAGEAGGSLLRPWLAVDFSLVNEQAKLLGQIAYRQGWSLTLAGPDLELRAKDGALSLAAKDFDLQPFTGLPLRLDSSYSGPIRNSRLPVKIYDPKGQTSISGWLEPARLAAELEGSVPGGRLRLAGAGGGWRLDLDSRWASGSLTYQGGRLEGGLDLDVPLPGGGLKGRLQAAAKRVRLSGYGQYAGELVAGLDPMGLRGELRGPGFALEANLSSLADGRWTGGLSLDLPGWGGVRLIGSGDGLRLSGSGGLQPLSGWIRQNPWRFDWSYRGQLPRNLGWLDASGNFPGTWLEGVWKFGGLDWKLSGSGAELRALTDGGQLLLRASGVSAELSGLRLGGLNLSGRVEGPWSELHFDLSGGGLHLKGVWGRKTELEFSGWLSGKVQRDGSGWRGNLAAGDARLAVSGSGLLPDLQGDWRGLKLAFSYPSLAVGGLALDLQERRAEGELKMGVLRLIGEGGTITAVYPLPDGRLSATLNLNSYRLEVNPDGAGEGSLTYQPQKGFAGRMTVVTPAGRVVASGDGGLRVSWKHPESDWLAWKKGELVFELGEGWSLSYSGGGLLTLTLTGGTGGVSLRLRSDWGGGELVYQNGWRGNLEVKGLPLPPLEAGLDASLSAEAGAMTARGELAGRAGRLSYSLRADAGGLLPKLENAALVVEQMRLEKLPKLLNKLPYASGNISGTFAYGNGMLAGRLVSDDLTVAGETHPVEAALYWSSGHKTFEASIGDSNLVADWQGNDIYLTAELVRLPLHFLTGAWAGPFDGVGYWTGAARAHLRLDDLRKSYLVAVGERLEFTGGGDSLKGSAAVRYENGVFYLDDLNLSGKGSWRGGGYWGPDDADLTVEMDNTVFTPVLGVFPQLRRFKPSAAGSLSLKVKGHRAQLEVRDLAFGLATVTGNIQKLLLQADDARIKVNGQVALKTPYASNIEVSGSGNEKDLTLQLSGEVDLPAVGHLREVSGSLHWPDWNLDLRSGNARLSGRLWPLALRLTGELPVSLPEKYLQSGLVKTNLSLDYRGGEYVLGGEAEVVRAVLSRPEGKREVAFKEKKYTFPLRFDRVRIYSNGGIIIQEPLAKGEGEGEVYLGGDLADPYLSGEVRAIRGDFLLGRNRFLVDEGWARFTPAGGLYPDIYLLAHSEIRREEGTLVLYLETTGHFVHEKGRARLVLEPRIWALENGEPAPYSEEQLLAMLALGNGSLVEGAADLAIQNLLIAQLEYELSKALGLDIFTLDTQVFGGGGVESTQFTIGKYLSPDLLLTYSINLQGQQAVGAEYRIDGLRLRVESELGGDLLEPQVRFSLLYAIRPDLDLILKLQTGAMYLGLEWRF